MIEIYLVFLVGPIERLEGKAGPSKWVKIWTQLRKGPTVGGGFANLDVPILVLERDDGGVGAKLALIVHGRQ